MRTAVSTWYGGGMEAASNTSTVTLRVVGRDKKESLKSEIENIVTSPCPHKNKTLTVKE
jgi:hypothetical protein